MKLTNQQMQNLTVGALWSEEKEDGLHFYKCTKKQIASLIILSLLHSQVKR